MNKQRGFTLIELLVVIAIIGILAAVVLASLGTARNRGADAGVKANLHSVEAQAAVYAPNNGNSFGVYEDAVTPGTPTTCPTGGDTSGTGLFYDPTVEAAIDAALQDSGGGTSYCIAGGTDYAVAVSRPGNAPSGNWCVDSTGLKCGVSTTTPITGYVCTQPCVSQD